MRTGGGAGGGVPAGLGFAPQAPGAASGLRPRGQYDPQASSSVTRSPFSTTAWVDAWELVGRPELETMPRWSAERRAPSDLGARRLKSVFRRAAIGTLTVRRSAPSAFSALYPPSFQEGTKKEASPVRFAALKAADRAGEALAV